MGGTQRYLFATDTHGSEHLEAIVNAGVRAGAKHFNHLGDISYHSMSPFTENDNVLAEVTLQHLLEPQSPVHKDALDGRYSDEQIKSVSKAHDTAVKTAEKVSHGQYDYLASLVRNSGLNLGIVTAGNWDRTSSLKKAFGEGYMLNGVRNLDGITMGVTGGGGSRPGLRLPLKLGAENDAGADHPETEQYHHAQWGEVLAKQPQWIVSHVPWTPRTDVDEHIDLATRWTERTLKQLYVQGQPLPKAIFSGHKHDRFRMVFNQYGVLEISPGVGARHHNKGYRAGFCTVDADTETGTIERVHEYHILDHHDGTQTVTLHATHTPDYTTKKVTSQKVGEVVLDHFKPSFKEIRDLDPTHALAKKGMSFNYASIKSAREKDIRVRQNFALVNEYVEQRGEDLKLIFDSLQHEQTSLDEKIAKAQELLIKKAATDVRVDINRLARNDEERQFYQNAVLGFAYDLDQSDLRRLLRVSDGKIPYDWGSQVIRHVQKHTQKIYQQMILSRLTANDFTEMALVHAPQGYKAKRNLLYEDAIGLWAKTLAQQGSTGLLTTDDLESSGLFVKDKSYTPRQRTASELEKLVGITLPARETPQTIEQERTALARELRDNLQQYVNQGGPVVDIGNGNYGVLSPDGRNIIPQPKKAFDGVTGYTPLSREQFGQALRRQMSPPDSELQPDSRNPYQREDQRITPERQAREERLPLAQRDAYGRAVN